MNARDYWENQMDEENIRELSGANMDIDLVSENALGLNVLVHGMKLRIPKSIDAQ
jgi:hypothetical protein